MFQAVRLAVVPEAAEVVPGSRLLFSLTLKNASPVVDRYRLEVEGVPADWISIDKPTVSLFPGASEQVEVSLQPPEGTTTAAGDYPITFRAVSEDDPTARAEALAALTVGAVGGLSMELLPAVAEGRTGTFRVTFHNGSNRVETVALEVRDNEEGVRFRATPEGSVEVPPGGEVAVTVLAKPKVRETIGEPHIYDVEFRGVQAGADGVARVNPALERQARYTYRPPITALMLPPWLRRLPGWALGALMLLLIILLLLAGNPTARAAKRLASAVASIGARPTPRPAPTHIPVPTVKPTTPPTPTLAPTVTPRPSTTPAPTATPIPTATPVPAGSPPRIQHFGVQPGANGAVTVAWAVSHSGSVRLNGQSVEATGQRALHLTHVTTVVLSARSASGTGMVTQVLRVAPAPPRKPILVVARPVAFALPTVRQFTARSDPTTGAPTLVWDVTGADAVTLNGAPVAASASQTVTLNTSSATAYHLRATDRLGAVTATVVLPRASSHPLEHGVTVLPPRIARFTLVHTNGHPYTLVWQTSGATQVLLDGQPVAARDSVALHAPLRSATYGLTATNDGGSATAQVRVVVRASAVTSTSTSTSGA